MHNSAKFQSPPLSVPFICLWDNVYHKQEVHLSFVFTRSDCHLTIITLSRPKVQSVHTQTLNWQLPYLSLRYGVYGNTCQFRKARAIFIKHLSEKTKWNLGTSNFKDYGRLQIKLCLIQCKLFWYNKKKHTRGTTAIFTLLP